MFNLGMPIVIAARQSSFLKSAPSVYLALATQNKIAPV